MSAVLTMRFKVEITLPGGQKIFHNAEAVVFVRECAYELCQEEFRTQDPRQIYCDPPKCGKAAANLRAKKGAQ